MARRITIIERRMDGPTAERLLHAQNHFHVGDDKQGGKVYQFVDGPLDRLYTRLIRSAGRRDEEEMRLEYAALLKYRRHWHSAGLEPSVGSVDLNRIFASDASNMSGMAKSERQVSHRQQYRRAGEYLMSDKSLGPVKGHAAIVLLDNFVCYEWEMSIASGMSPYLFRKTIRCVAQQLAYHWGL